MPTPRQCQRLKQAMDKLGIGTNELVERMKLSTDVERRKWKGAIANMRSSNPLIVMTQEKADALAKGLGIEPSFLMSDSIWYEHRDQLPMLKGATTSPSGEEDDTPVPKQGAGRVLLRQHLQDNSWGAKQLAQALEGRTDVSTESVSMLSDILAEDEPFPTSLARKLHAKWPAKFLLEDFGLEKDSASPSEPAANLPVVASTTSDVPTFFTGQPSRSIPLGTHVDLLGAQLFHLPDGKAAIVLNDTGSLHLLWSLLRSPEPQPAATT